VTRVTVRAGLVAIAAAGVALVVGAQGPPGGFGGPGGPGPGMFEFGGLMGGFGGKTVKGKPFQASFTITTVQTLPGNSISSTKTGTVARDADGSTYRDVTFSGIGPWASTGKNYEFAYIRNLSTSTEYIVNVTKGTYEAFPLREHNARHEGKGGPRGSAGSDETVNDNSNATYTDTTTNTVYKVDDRLVTRTIPAGQIGNSAPIVITTERWYSSDLDVLLKETRSDPRFGATTYQLANIGQPQASLFVPNPSFTQVQGRGFGPHGHKGPDPPPPPPQD
jgi:hypothetical protein